MVSQTSGNQQSSALPRLSGSNNKSSRLPRAVFRLNLYIMPPQITYIGFDLAERETGVSDA